MLNYWVCLLPLRIDPFHNFVYHMIWSVTDMMLYKYNYAGQ